MKPMKTRTVGGDNKPHSFTSWRWEIKRSLRELRLINLHRKNVMK